MNEFSHIAKKIYIDGPARGGGYSIISNCDVTPGKQKRGLWDAGEGGNDKH